MRYEHMSYSDFKKHFIDNPDGFMPVYAYFGESHEGETLKTVRIDFICEWRLTDGKVKFLEVPFDTKVELEQIREYLKVCAKMLHDKICDKADKLEYDKNFKA